VAVGQRVAGAAAFPVAVACIDEVPVGMTGTGVNSSVALTGPMWCSGNAVPVGPAMPATKRRARAATAAAAVAYISTGLTARALSEVNMDPGCVAFSIDIVDNNLEICVFRI
jgi:hypothetical protein